MVAGEIIAGPQVRDACARHLSDLGRQGTPGFPYVWNPEIDGKRPVVRVLSFFRQVLKLDGGDLHAKPFDPLPWQAFVLGSIFGWVHADTLHRRFQLVFIETGKGSGKSPLAAGIGIYMLTADGESRAEVYSAAVDKEQAGILFRDAVSMTKLSPALDSRVRRSGGEGREYNIAYLGMGSFFRPISSESTGRGKSGYRPHCALLDEVHEHPTNAMVEFMRAGTKNRRQALIFMITNSGFDRTSVCFEYHTYAVRVARDELQDDSFFGYVCMIDEDEDPLTDEVDPALGYPRSWAKTSPSLGVTIPVSYLDDQVRQALGMPSKESIVRRLNFCQWVGAENPWIDGDKWRACEVAGLDVPDGGWLCLDLSASRDLTAAGRAVKIGDTVLAEVLCWTPEETMVERSRRDRVPYDDWVRAGHLITVPGRTIDHDFVARDLAERGWLSGEMYGCAYDMWNMKYFTPALDRAGVAWWEYEGPDKPQGSGLCMVRHGQGTGGGASDSVLWMPESIRVFASLILAGKFKVKQNPVLTYASASAVLAQDATGNQKWEKRKSTGRIDPIVALSMGVGAAMAEGLNAAAPSYSIHFL